jgi:hypothetical protein
MRIRSSTLSQGQPPVLSHRDVSSGPEMLKVPPAAGVGTFGVSENIGWVRGQFVAADGEGTIGHARAVLLRACAESTLVRCLVAGASG